jgi:putative acetyltransferase
VSAVITIARADARDASVRALIEASDAYMASLYPSESNHLLDLDTLARPEMRFYAIEADGEVLGCGGFWKHRDYAEVKRVFVHPKSRGLGLSRKLMLFIEDEMRREGFMLARLETGVSQPEALGLYRALGYVSCGPFGAYKLDPLSVFMEKRLSD